MTQAKLADWLGVATMHVSHLEQGVRPAGRQTVRLLDILAERVGANPPKSSQPKRSRKP
jgi:DNA-binding transcriptional regulator YiaG